MLAPKHGTATSYAEAKAIAAETEKEAVRGLPSSTSTYGSGYTTNMERVDQPAKE